MSPNGSHADQRSAGQRRRRPSHLLGLLLVLAVGAAAGAGPAVAAPVSSDRLGVNGGAGTPAISIASGNGLGVMRAQLIEGMNADPVVAEAAAAHLRIYPMLGLRTQLAPADAATAMASYVTSFAQRYGPGGTFWAQHPTLTPLPVESYEIGNEPNIPPQYVADSTHLHWSGWPDPSDYALVYASARSALHAVNPTLKAVVGGLADSAMPGVSLSDDEEWLAALTPGQVDAVGYHPYTFPVGFSTMYSDTQQLRQWMDAHGMGGVPLDINEFGACDVQPQDTLSVVGCNPSIPSAQWGSFAANLTGWSLCSSQLNVESVLPEYWGDEANTDVNALLALVSSEGTLTPYGADYLGEAHTLTTSGCPLTSTSSPTVSGAAHPGDTLTAGAGGWSGPATVAYQWERCDSAAVCVNIPGATSASYAVQSGDLGSTLVVSVTTSIPAGSAVAWSAPTGVVSPAPPAPPAPPSGGGTPGGGSPPAHIASLAPMFLKVSGVHVSGHLLSLAVHAVPRSGKVIVVARKGHRLIHLHITGHKRHGLTVFSAVLPAGKWKLTVACTPPAGYATPAAVRRTITV